eukprot:664111-Prorocentrum_minimum.AAC.1
MECQGLRCGDRVYETGKATHLLGTMGDPEDPFPRRRLRPAHTIGSVGSSDPSAHTVRVRAQPRGAIRRPRGAIRRLRGGTRRPRGAIR